jgi:hypothetical protein
MWSQHGPSIVAHRARQTKGLPILAIVPKFVQHNRTVAQTSTECGGAGRSVRVLSGHAT